MFLRLLFKSFSVSSFASSSSSFSIHHSKILLVHRNLNPRSHHNWIATTTINAVSGSLDRICNRINQRKSFNRSKFDLLHQSSRPASLVMFSSSSSSSKIKSSESHFSNARISSETKVSKELQEEEYSWNESGQNLTTKWRRESASENYQQSNNPESERLLFVYRTEEDNEEESNKKSTSTNSRPRHRTIILLNLVVNSISLLFLWIIFFNPLKVTFALTSYASSSSSSSSSISGDEERRKKRGITNDARNQDNEFDDDEGIEKDSSLLLSSSPSSSDFSSLISDEEEQESRRIVSKKCKSNDSESSESEEEEESGDKVQYRRTLLSDAQFILIKLLPLKLVSRLWGWINNSLPLPLPLLRSWIIGTYATAFGCDLQEAAEPDLTKYRNLGDFFRRSLKPGVRPIDERAEVVSPADGTLVHFGLVQNERIEQVKGVDYSLKSFLGPQSWPTQAGRNFGRRTRTDSLIGADEDVYHEHLLIAHNQCSDSEHDTTPKTSEEEKKREQKKNKLFHCVIYLAPGDYHRFHSPANWTVRFRRHFSGKLLSIRPSFMSWIEDLFTLNERVAYLGTWKHGFFSMTAVGATNVGSVRVYFDHELRTNTIRCRIGTYRDRLFNNTLGNSYSDSYSAAAVTSSNSTTTSSSDQDGVGVGGGIIRRKGQEFGEFNLGSTIVLIFEAPPDFVCSVRPGSKIKYGQSLFSASPASTASSPLLKEAPKL